MNSAKSDPDAGHAGRRKGRRSASAEPPDTAHAVPVASRVWWVGSFGPGEDSPCHAYLIENGRDSVLVDPGSPLTFPDVMRRVAEVVPLDRLRWIVCHHPEPDACASLRLLDAVIRRPDAAVVTERRAEPLLRHYGGAIPFWRVDDNGWALELDEGRRLEFSLAPSLYFPGALVSFETSTETLFSGSLFGGFPCAGQQSGLYADDESQFERITGFHQHYMPSRDLLSAGIQVISGRWPGIKRIAPLHGSIIEGDLVPSTLAALSALDCGAQGGDTASQDVSRLVAIAATGRRAIDAFLAAGSVEELGMAAVETLSDALPVVALEAYVDLPDEGWVRLHAGLGDVGEPVGEPPAPDPARVAVTVPADDSDDVPLVVHLLLGAPVSLSPPLDDLLRRVSPGLRVAVARALTARAVLAERARLLDTASRDPLSGMLNRRGLESILLPEEYAVIEFDIDHFHKVNDTFGHDAGDAVLNVVSDVMRATVRADDRCVRLGGEEFLVLLPAADVGTARTIAARVRASVSVVDLSGRAPGGRVSLSAGVAMRHPGEPLADVLTRVDSALHRAKEAGRNRVEADTSSH